MCVCTRLFVCVRVCARASALPSTRTVRAQARLTKQGQGRQICNIQLSPPERNLFRSSAQHNNRFHTARVRSRHAVAKIFARFSVYLFVEFSLCVCVCARKHKQDTRIIYYENADTNIRNAKITFLFIYAHTGPNTHTSNGAGAIM